MAKAEFNGYGGKQDFLPCEAGKVAPFVDKSGGPVDAYGDWEKKEKSAIDMNAGAAFNKKDFTKVEAMGTECAKKKVAQRSDNNGDHFSVGEVAPFGNEAGKDKSYQSSKRA